MKMQRVWNGRKLVYRPISKKVEVQGGQVQEQKQQQNDIDERRRLAAEIAKSL